MTGGAFNVDEIDAATRESAQGSAEAGAKLAREAGLDARPRICAQFGTVAGTIVATAAELEATAIVVGSRGLTGLKSQLLGSVSHALLQHADRIVIVVPSPAVAAARASRPQISDDHERNVGGTEEPRPLARA